VLSERGILHFGEEIATPEKNIPSRNDKSLFNIG